MVTQVTESQSRNRFIASENKVLANYVVRTC
jgi:hypothetical protein